MAIKICIDTLSVAVNPALLVCFSTPSQEFLLHLKKYKQVTLRKAYMYLNTNMKLVVHGVCMAYCLHPKTHIIYA